MMQAARAPVNNSGFIDLYGNEADYLLPLLKSALTTEIRSTCDLSSCPLPVQKYRTCNINLACSSNKATFESSLSEWLNPGASSCQRRFKSKPLPGVPCKQDIITDCNGGQVPAWYCSGVRANLPRQFCNFKNIFVFSVDLLSTGGQVEWEMLPASLVLNSIQLHLHSATLWNGNHYICTLSHFNTCFIYDGLKVKQGNPTSGLSVYNSQPRGYMLSHVVYTA